jgi:hypothetical protein
VPIRRIALAKKMLERYKQKAPPIRRAAPEKSVPQQSPLSGSGDPHQPAPPSSEGWDDVHYGDAVPESFEPEPPMDDDVEDLLAGAPLPDDLAPSDVRLAPGSTGARMAKAFEQAVNDRPPSGRREPSEMTPEQRIPRASENMASLQSIIKLASLNPAVRFDAYAAHLPPETALAIRTMMNDLGLSPQNETVVMSMLFGHLVALATTIPDAVDRSAEDALLRFQVAAGEFGNVLMRALGYARAIAEEADARRDEEFHGFTTRVAGVLGEEIQAALKTAIDALEERGRLQQDKVEASGNAVFAKFETALGTVASTLRGSGIAALGDFAKGLDDALQIRVGPKPSASAKKETDAIAALERLKAAAWGALGGSVCLILLYGAVKLIQL